MEEQKWTLGQWVGEYFLGSETKKRFGYFKEKLAGHYERRTNFADISDEKKAEARMYTEQMWGVLGKLNRNCIIRDRYIPNAASLSFLTYAVVSWDAFFAMIITIPNFGELLILTRL